MDRLQISVMAASLALAMSLMATPAAAQDCQALVVDEAGALGAGIGQVQQAARELENRGAYVRVRTTTNFGGFPDVDRYEAALEARCSTWQDAAGGTKGNLIVLAVSFGEDRAVGLYYGDLWRSELNREWNPLLVNKVVPHLRSGNNVGALTGALGGIGDIIDVRQATRGATGTVVVQQPTDLTGLWNVMGWVLAIAVLIALVLAVRAWRQSVARTREAQQKAKLAMAACMEHVTGGDNVLDLTRSKVTAAAKDFSPTDLLPLEERIDRVSRSWQAALRRYGELNNADANPDKNGLTMGEYTQIAAEFERLTAEFRAARARMDDMDGELEKLQRLAADAQARIDEAMGAIKYAQARVEAVERAGFRVAEPRYELAEAIEAGENARGARDQKRYGAMNEHLVSATRTAQQAAEAAEEVASDKRELDGEIASTVKAIESTEEVIDQAATAFSAISREYGEASWSHITGNGSQAEAALGQAREMLTKAEASGGMDTQEWTQAHAELEQARGLVECASDLATAILNLKRDLEKAKAAAPGEIEAAQKDIRAAIEYIALHDADVDDGLEDELARATQALGEARTELASPTPNYIRVVKTALEINALADRVLEGAREQHQAAERQRQLAQTSMREADRSIEAADSYIRNHRSDVDSDAQREADEARLAYNQARAASSIRNQIDDAQRADQKADRALEMARADVRREQDARDRAARAAADAIAAVARAAAYRRHTASSSTRSGHGGGSIGFGGGGRRGGGSVGFGGRGGRGGGSTGW